MELPVKTIGAALLAASVSFANPAEARWYGRGWGGVGLGLAAGAIVGGVLAASTYPSYGYAYGYPGYSYGYPRYSYAYSYGYSYGYPRYSYGYPSYTLAYAGPSWGYYPRRAYYGFASAGPRFYSRRVYRSYAFAPGRASRLYHRRWR